MSVPIDNDELPRPRILFVAAHRIDVGALRVLDAPDVPRLTPKAMAVLLELAAQPGTTVPRDALLLRVWGERSPSDDVLTQAVRELRRAFGDDATAPRLIETVPRVGYRLLAAARWEATPAQADALPADVPLPRASVTRTWRTGSIAVVALICLALLAASLYGARQVEPRSMAYRVVSSVVLTADPGAEQLPHISPDGSRVAYVAVDPATQRRRIHVRTSVPSMPLMPTSGAGDETWPVWSADGASIAFLRRDASGCKLYTVPALGGAERARSACAGGVFDGFDLSIDGSQFMLAMLGRERGRTAFLSRHTLDGGDSLTFDYAHDPLQHDLSPRYSPDGRWIAFRRGLLPFCDLYVVASEGGPVRAVTHISARIRGFDWLADSASLVFASDHEGRSDLYTVELDNGRVTALGASPAQFPDAAKNTNSIVYEIPKLRSMMVGALLEESSTTITELAPSTGSDSYPALSPDGTRVAFVSDRNGSLQLWLHSSVDAQSWPLTTDSRTVFLYPEWRNDGQRVVVTRRRDGRGSLVEVDLASQSQRIVSKPDQDVRYGVHAPLDDQFLVIIATPDGPALYRNRVVDNALVSTLLASQVAAVQVNSATGQIYYSRTDEAGLFAIPAQGGSAQRLAGSERIDTRFAWRIAANSVWYFDASATDTLQLQRRSLADGQATLAWVPALDIDHTHFSLSQDGRRVVVTTSTRNDTDVGLLRILRKAD